jgi:cell division protein ZapE
MVTLKVENKDITLNCIQIEVLDILNDIKSNILKKTNNSFFKTIILTLLRKKAPINNIYIYGKVGRGKSMLMKNFFNNIDIKNKIYFHFNDFMHHIHLELHKIRSKNKSHNNKIIEIAIKNVVKGNILICLDEFQVDDVTDALILRKIVSYFIKKDITIIFTSNSKPEDLYQNGLQRDLFLEFVNNILKKNCKIFNLNSEIDYRNRFLHKVKKHYFYPINKKNKTNILNIFSHLSHEGEASKEELEISKNRKITINKAFENIAIFDFNELCQNALGSKDYKEICIKYNIIFLLNIPRLEPEDRNEAKRLILFIDAAYEKKITLLILSEVEIDNIYIKGTDSFKFKRTASRLKEMMSDSYGEFLN